MPLQKGFDHALEFAAVVFVGSNIEQGYAQLSDGGKHHASVEKFRKTIPLISF
jgi:hypothetical protein